MIHEYELHKLGQQHQTCQAIFSYRLDISMIMWGGGRESIPSLSLFSIFFQRGGFLALYCTERKTGSVALSMFLFTEEGITLILSAAQHKDFVTERNLYGFAVQITLFLRYRIFYRQKPKNHKSELILTFTFLYTTIDHALGHVV